MSWDGPGSGRTRGPGSEVVPVALALGGRSEPLDEVAGAGSALVQLPVALF